MEQRRAREPGHERGVFHRVPEPEAAPAQLVIGPPAAQRDAQRQRRPGEQRPGPHPARPGGVDAALDQAGDGEGEGHGKPDIAEIEQGRMKREARVLEQRIEVVAVERRRVEAEERIRGRQDEDQEADPDQPLDRKHPGTQGGGQVAAEQRDQPAVERQDPDPENERALVVAPHAGEFVEQGLRGVGIVRHVRDGKIRHDEGVHQAGERRRNEEELRRHRGPGQRHPGRVVPLCADQRHQALDDRQREGQDQGVMTDLGDHGAAPFSSAPCQMPASLSASATSLGM